MRACRHSTRDLYHRSTKLRVLFRMKWMAYNCCRSWPPQMNLFVSSTQLNYMYLMSSRSSMVSNKSSRQLEPAYPGGRTSNELKYGVSTLRNFMHLVPYLPSLVSSSRTKQPCNSYLSCWRVSLKPTKSMTTWSNLQSNSSMIPSLRYSGLPTTNKLGWWRSKKSSSVRSLIGLGWYRRKSNDEESTKMNSSRSWRRSCLRHHLNPRRDETQRRRKSSTSRRREWGMEVIRRARIRNGTRRTTSIRTVRDRINFNPYYKSWRVSLISSGVRRRSVNVSGSSFWSPPYYPSLRVLSGVVLCWRWVRMLNSISVICRSPRYYPCTKYSHPSWCRLMGVTYPSRLNR